MSLRYVDRNLVTQSSLCCWVAVLAPAWRAAPEEIGSRALAFLQELESLLGEFLGAPMSTCHCAVLSRPDLRFCMRACKGCTEGMLHQECR